MLYIEKRPNTSLFLFVLKQDSHQNVQIIKFLIFIIDLVVKHS